MAADGYLLTRPLDKKVPSDPPATRKTENMDKTYRARLVQSDLF